MESQEVWGSTSGKREITRDLEWCVRALALGKSYNEIATEEACDEECVKKAVQRAMDLIGLSRQEGRPKGRKDSKTAPRQTGSQ